MSVPFIIIKERIHHFLYYAVHFIFIMSGLVGSLANAVGFCGAGREVLAFIQRINLDLMDYNDHFVGFLFHFLLFRAIGCMYIYMVVQGCKSPLVPDGLKHGSNTTDPFKGTLLLLDTIARNWPSMCPLTPDDIVMDAHRGEFLIGHLIKHLLFVEVFLHFISSSISRVDVSYVIYLILGTSVLCVQGT